MIIVPQKCTMQKNSMEVNEKYTNGKFFFEIQTFSYRISLLLIIFFNSLFCFFSLRSCSYELNWFSCMVFLSLYIFNILIIAVCCILSNLISRPFCQTLHFYCNCFIVVFCLFCPFFIGILWHSNYYCFVECAFGLPLHLIIPQ